MLKLSTMLLSQELNTAFVPSFTEFVQMVSLHLAGYTYIILYSNVHDMLLFYYRCASKRFNNVLSTSSSRYSDLIDCALLGYAAPTKFGVTPG